MIKSTGSITKHAMAAHAGVELRVASGEGVTGMMGSWSDTGWVSLWVGLVSGGWMGSLACRHE